MIWRRFKIKGNDKDLFRLENLIKEKNITRQDLKLILSCLEINESSYID